MDIVITIVRIALGLFGLFLAYRAYIITKGSVLFIQERRKPMS